MSGRSVREFMRLGDAWLGAAAALQRFINRKQPLQSFRNPIPIKIWLDTDHSMGSRFSLHDWIQNTSKSSCYNVFSIIHNIVLFIRLSFYDRWIRFLLGRIRTRLFLEGWIQLLAISQANASVENEPPSQLKKSVHYMYKGRFAAVDLNHFSACSI